MGGGCLQERRPYWVIILPHYVAFGNCRGLNVLYVFMFYSCEKNPVLPIEKLSFLVLPRNVIML